MSARNEFTSKLQEVIQGSSVGLCVKANDGVIRFQNDSCLQNCGSQVGQVCALECVVNNAANLKRVLGHEGLSFFNGTTVNSNAVDAVLVGDTNTVTTLFYPRRESIDAQFEELSKFGLSKRESEILNLVLQRSTRKQIAEKLCISLSTLKTHLNNIYKKLPQDWARRLQDRRV